MAEGLFGADWNDPRTMATLQMAAGLMAAGGPSERPSNLGLGLLGGLQQYQSVMGEAQRRELQQAQIEKARAEAKARSEMASAGLNPDDPAAWREWKLYQALSPEEQSKYLELKRQQWGLGKVNDLLTQVPLRPGFGTPQPLTTPEAEASGRAYNAGAVTRAQEREKAQFDILPGTDPTSGRGVFGSRLGQLSAMGVPTAPMPAPTGAPPVVSVAPQRPMLPATEGEPLRAATRERMVGEAKTEVERAAAAPQKLSALESTLERGKAVTDTLDKAYGMIDWTSSGFVGQKSADIGGTTAANLNKLLDTVRANIGFKELQEMRFNSPTGGALGQVAVQELQMLQSVLGSLDLAQSPTQLRGQVKDIKDRYASSMKMLESAMKEEQKWLTQRGGQSSGATRGAVMPGRRFVDDEGGEWEFIGGDPNNRINWKRVR